MKTQQQVLKYTPKELAFGTSGLRGLVTDMTDIECYINTRGFIQFLKNTSDKTPEMICVAGDLRDSTPRIMQAVAQAVSDEGMDYENCGFIPTPALAYYALQNGQPCIMVTGSHIPADRNGIKFYTVDGEILKEDEKEINQSVAAVRSQVYKSTNHKFNNKGMFEDSDVVLSEASDAATVMYKKRYIDAFGGDALSGYSVVMYQHSAVGRDQIVDILLALGAQVKAVGRSSVFVPIDSENVTPADKKYFKKIAEDNPGCDAIISTDGDSDRPFMVDETGHFYPGDILGLPTSSYLGIDAAAYPISANDAVEQFLVANKIDFSITKIGSPYVISAMKTLEEKNDRVAGWEVNGGYLLGTEVIIESRKLLPLPTRDAVLPLVATMLQAKKHGKKISEVFQAYPKRYTSAGLLDNFPLSASREIVHLLTKNDEQAISIIIKELGAIKNDIELVDTNTTDGVRLRFSNNEVLHIRPSGNAPQLRVYSNADNQQRADEIVANAVFEPDGLLRKLEAITV